MPIKIQIFLKDLFFIEYENENCVQFLTKKI